jgi:hypothetical protein
MRFAQRMPYGKGVQILADGRTVRKTVQCHGLDKLEFMKTLCLHLIRYPDPQIVPVYQFQELMRSEHIISYSYDMARLGLLSWEEGDIIDRVANLYDRFGNETFHNVGEGEFVSVERNFPNLYRFLFDLCQQYRYHDLHADNVRLDAEGNYRIIDLEGFIRYPLHSRENSWITKE